MSFLLIRITHASVTRVFMIRLACTDLQTNNISVNVRLVTREKIAKKVTSKVIVQVAFFFPEKCERIVLFPVKRDPDTSLLLPPSKFSTII